jgi:hypothetical protein
VSDIKRTLSYSSSSVVGQLYLHRRRGKGGIRGKGQQTEMELGETGGMKL